MVICPTVTPLEIQDRMEVLISLDGIPVIASHERYLLVGADPWQFGVPSVPMLYKILSNWLIHELGFTKRLAEPYAAIRIDDLPITAEELKFRPASRKLDKKRARTVTRLRKFARRTGTVFTLMYSSHYQDRTGRPGNHRLSDASVDKRNAGRRQTGRV